MNTTSEKIGFWRKLIAYIYIGRGQWNGSTAQPPKQKRNNMTKTIKMNELPETGIHIRATMDNVHSTHRWYATFPTSFKECSGATYAICVSENRVSLVQFALVRLAQTKAAPTTTKESSATYLLAKGYAQACGVRNRNTGSKYIQLGSLTLVAPHISTDDQVITTTNIDTKVTQNIH